MTERIMIPEEQHWQVALRLKLLEVSGDAFQEFFSDLMKEIYFEDFCRVEPQGALGDKGCDGYLLSRKSVFQCYGAKSHSRDKVKTLIGKMKSDFEKAKKYIPKMREWYMVHNTSLPFEAIPVLEKIREDNPNVICEFIAPEKIESMVKGLPRKQKEALLGPIVTNQDAVSMQPNVLKEVVDDLVVRLESYEIDMSDISPVSAEKLDANRLPPCWNIILKDRLKNTYAVANYIHNISDPKCGQKLAAMFNDNYNILKHQNLDAGEIMDNLYKFINGVGHVPTERQIVAQALLAYFFERCDIFENVEFESNP